MNARTPRHGRSIGPTHSTTLLLLLCPAMIAGGCVPDVSVEVVSEGSVTSDGSSDTGAMAGTTSSGGAAETDTAAEEGSSGDEMPTGDASSSGSNSAPPEAIDDALFGKQDQPAIAPAKTGLLANDTDPDGGPLEVVAFDRSSAAGGNVFVSADGSAQYTPPYGYWGRDMFGYAVQNDGGAEASAAVAVHVAPEHVSLGQLDGDGRGFVINGEVENNRAGTSLSAAGDINGDGLGDLLVGTLGFQLLEGRSYVVFGKADHAPVELSDVSRGQGGFVIDPEPGTGSTVSVVGAGDVNGDGRQDVLVLVNTAFFPFRRAYIVFGKADSTAVDLLEVADGVGGFRLNPEQDGDPYWLTSGAAAGDVDGDGLDDIIIGSFAAHSDFGRAYLIFGKADTDAVELASITAGVGGFAIDGEEAGSETGRSVAGLGDLDGDGLDDLLVGAPHFGEPHGAAYVVFGKEDTTRVELAAVHAGVGGFAMVGSQGILQAGEAVSRLDDFNGDGTPDMLISGESERMVVYGKAETAAVNLATLAEDGRGLVLTSEQNAPLWRGAGVGDVNADGRGDVLISSATLTSDGGEGAGRGYVVYGSDTAGPINMADIVTGDGGWGMDGVAPFDFAGAELSGAGDVNGDGVDDLMIASTGADPNGSNSGQVYVVFGIPTQ